MSTSQEFEKWLKENVKIMQEVVNAIRNRDGSLKSPMMQSHQDDREAFHHFHNDIKCKRANAKQKIDEFLVGSYWTQIEPHRAEIEYLVELFAMVNYKLEINWNLSRVC